jgi:Xaa-Pro dipeptidase
MNEAQLSEIYAQRSSRLTEALARYRLDALALNPGPTLTYLTGLNFHLMERPVVALFTPDKPPVIVHPELEKAKIEALPFPATAFPYGEDPTEWPAAFRRATQYAGVKASRVGVEPTHMRLLEFRYLKEAAPEADFVFAEEALALLRACKDETEIANMRRAVQIAQQALRATLSMIQPGVSEREIAAELSLQLLRAGSDAELAFQPIVSGGPNSANPHAVPGERRLQNGDLLVIDWGAVYHGYVSDLTRTFAIGKVEAEYQRIADVVEQANAAGRAAARPGVACQEVDRAAREVITNAGYGEYFIHRTGHGIGMEGHEAPYIRQGNPQPLEPGMAFTVEPGIYLPGQGGVRIEDNVVITAGGAETLSDLPRDLQILPL